MKVKLFLYSFTFLFFQCAIAQNSYTTKKTATGKAKKMYDRANEYSNQGLYEKALKDFNTAIKDDNKFIDAHFMRAAMLFNLERYEEAEKSFEDGIRINSGHSGKAYYTLAVLEQRLNKFSEATEHFQNYIDHPKARDILKKKAKRNLEICQFSMTATNQPVPFEPKSLGDLINTNKAEYLPSFTADGETLIYTRVVRGQEDFYLSTKNEGKWLAGIPLEKINTELNEGAQNISVDGKFLVFTACQRKDGLGSCDLYYSEVRDGRWTAPANIGAPINTRGWESQPSLSADGKSLFFASKRKGGKGGDDIWVSHRAKNGKWGIPENIDAPINTAQDDQSPFIHPDGKTLYFMSKGHPGMGGHDLFLSKKQKDGSWGKPQNLGYPINTIGNEGALVVSLDGKTAYFASDRKYANTSESVFDNPTSGGETDLYSFQLYKDIQPLPVTYVKAKVFDAVTKLALSVNVEFITLEDGKTHVSSITDNDGEFLVCLPIGKNYSLNVSKKKYLFHSENFSLTNVKGLDKAFSLEIYLQPIPEKIIAQNPSSQTLNIAKPIILKNVFFDTGSAKLRSISFTELDGLFELLTNNPTLDIQINGHTDTVGSDEDNLELSNNRAKSVYDYLIKKGINISRLNYKGFGETKPIDSNDTDEGRQNNRRTEFEVVR